MEDYKEWRDEKAQELKEIPDHTARREKLEKIKKNDYWSYLGAKDAKYFNLPDRLKPKLNKIDEIIPGIKVKGIKQIITGDEKISRQSDILHERFDSPYHSNFIKYEEKNISEFKPYFENKILVDLGAGDYLYQLHIANKLGVKAYVAVEPIFFKGMKRGLSKAYNQMSLPIALIAEDALTFLKRLPNESVCISAFGIDGTIIPDDKMRRKIADEIARVLDRSGAFLSYGSALDSPLLTCKKVSYDAFICTVKVNQP